MEYFKIIYNNTIIGVVTSDQFVRYSPVNQCLLYCSKNKGQYVIYDGKLYRDSWMKPIYQLDECIETEVKKIDEEEYTILYNSLKTNEEIEIIEVEPEPESELDPVEPPSITTEFVRASKLKEMSNTCRRTIEAGFDLELRGETHHFSLSAQDQLNLMSVSTLMQTEQFIPYHADNEPQKFYTTAEMQLIINGANNHRNYHTTYYNALKAYINSLDSIEAIAAITYGTPIPEAFQSEVWQVMTH